MQLMIDRSKSPEVFFTNATLVVESTWNSNLLDFVVSLCVVKHLVHSSNLGRDNVKQFREKKRRKNRLETENQTCEKNSRNRVVSSTRKTVKTKNTRTK